MACTAGRKSADAADVNNAAIRAAEFPDTTVNNAYALYATQDSPVQALAQPELKALETRKIHIKFNHFI